MNNEQSFPIDIKSYKEVSLDINQETLSEEQKKQIQKNISIFRDSIIFFTGLSAKKGLGGHTGGAYDIVPEAIILEGFMKGSSKISPVHFDEAGHRVALQYLLSVIHGELEPESLLHYREHKKNLPGHPEKSLTPGVMFSSGRLGHLWSHVNGLAAGNPDKTFVILGSDGSQEEGNDSEAARFCVAQQLNVKLFIDDNDVTIAGHPSEYMKGYGLKRTFKGHELPVDETDGENIDELYSGIRKALIREGPFALICKRKMMPGIKGIEGTTKGHDAISPDIAIEYLKEKGHHDAARIIENAEKMITEEKYLGSGEWKKNREEFGKSVAGIMKQMDSEERNNILIVDNDLEGSTGIKILHEQFPERYISGGIMERNNFSVAAGFGSEPGKQGIFATFSAFLEMIISEATMARLNESDVLAHFSHAGVDEMADNTCHYGINIFFADNGIEKDKTTRLYFPADAGQMKALVNEVIGHRGLRFVFSTRSATPQILKEDGTLFYDEGYSFQRDKDELIREGKSGAIVTYGEMTYRCLDAVETLRKKGISVSLINKPTLNVPDEGMLEHLKEFPFVLVVESQNRDTGLGSRFGTWLLERGFNGRYAHIGTNKPGEGGLREHITYQGLGPESIIKLVEEFNNA